MRNEEKSYLIDMDELFRTIFERAAIGIALVDLDGRPITINPALQEMLGYTKNEISKMVFTEFTHPEDAAKDWELYQRLVSGEIDHYRMEKRYYRKNGEIVHGLLNVSLVKAAKDDSNYILATVDNITDRNEAESDIALLNQLMQAVHNFLDLEELYNVALDNIKSMDSVDMAIIYLVDEETNEAVMQAQRNFPETFLKRASRIPHPKGITWKVINRGEIINIEDAQKDPDIGPAGRELGHHSILGIPISSKEKTIGVIWFLSYRERKFNKREVRVLSAFGYEIGIAIAKAKMIQELKLKQEQLIQSEKLASMGQMISSIAHEINNPLTPIIGYSQKLLTRTDLDQKLKGSLEIMHDSAQRVYKIIDKLLSFSRKYAPAREPVDINSLVEESLEFRAYQLNLANIEVVKDLKPDIPKVTASPNQIQQVLTNMIINAEQSISSSKNHGRLQVKTKIKNKKWIEVFIADDGPGIPKKIAGKIFDPFFTTKDPGKGTGLGLYVAYGIIKDHGGNIELLKNGKKGAKFVIEFPIEDSIMKPKINPEEQSGNNLNTIKKKRVLIVEDEDMITELIKVVLEQEDNTVEIAKNGREALEKIRTTHYDVIVSDVKMPEINGIQFYDEIRENNPGLIRNILFITGDPSFETMEFLNQIDNPFLVKPFKIEKFMSCISELMAHENL